MIRTKQLTPNERIKAANAWLSSNPIHTERNKKGYDITFQLRKNHKTTGGEWERALVPGNNQVTLCITPRIAGRPTGVFKYISDKYAGMGRGPWHLADESRDAWTAARKFDLLSTLASREWLPYDGTELTRVTNKYLADRSNYGVASGSGVSTVFMLRDSLSGHALTFDTKQMKAAGGTMTLGRHHIVIDPFMVKSPADLISRITAFANEHDLGAIWGEEQRLGLLTFILKQAKL